VAVAAGMDEEDEDDDEKEEFKGSMIDE